MIDIKKARRIPKNADLSRIHPDLRDKAVPCSLLTAHPDNPRVHPEANKRAIAGSLKRFQQRNLIVVNRTEAGLRIEAHHEVFRQMLQLGSEYVAVAIMEDDPLTELGFLLADNRTGDLSEDDPARLAPILKQLAEAGEEVEEVGWDEASVKALLHSPDKEEKKASAADPAGDTPQTDRAEQLQQEWQTARGQIWEIVGKQTHRVMCGDCREVLDVEMLLNGQKVNVAFTSPPYASQRKYDESSGFKPIKPDAYVEWFEAVQANVRAHLAADGSWFVNIKEHCEDGQRHLYVKDLTIAHVRSWEWRFVDELCWRDTRNGMPGKFTNRFKDAWEPVFHFCRQPLVKFNPVSVGVESDQCFDYDPATKRGHDRNGMKTGTPAGGMKTGIALPSNVLEIAAQSDCAEHSAGFPVALPSFFIKAFSDAGDLIFDPFLGSGTTLIAAEREGRRGYGMEISPKYLAVILQRAKDAGMSPRLADA